MWAKEILDKTCFSNPKTLIIHTRTNDLEHPTPIESLMKNAIDIVELINTKYPACRVILSSFLPRSHYLNKAVDLNECLSKALFARKNTTFVRHNIRAKDHVHDKKHLNKVGVEQFAQNLKWAYFNQETHLNTANWRSRSPHSKSHSPSNYPKFSHWPPFTSHVHPNPTMLPYIPQHHRPLLQPPTIQCPEPKHHVNPPARKRQI